MHNSTSFQTHHKYIFCRRHYKVKLLVRILGVIRLTHQHLWRCSVSSEQTTIFSLASSSESRLLCSDNLLANCMNHDPAGLGSGSSFRWASPDNKGNMVVCWQDNTFYARIYDILLFYGKYWVTLPSAFANHCVRSSAVNAFTRYSPSTNIGLCVQTGLLAGCANVDLAGLRSCGLLSTLVWILWENMVVNMLCNRQCDHTLFGRYMSLLPISIGTVLAI